MPTKAFSLDGFVDDIKSSSAFKPKKRTRPLTDEEIRIELAEREAQDERERNERLPLLAQIFPNTFKARDFFSDLGL